MSEILDNFDDSIDLKDYKFRGSMAGFEWKYEQAQDRLKKLRWMIFALVPYMFYPAVMAVATGKTIPQGYLFERIAFSVLFIIAGLVYARNRIMAIAIALVPMLLIVLTYISRQFIVTSVGVNLGIAFLLASGIYFHNREKKLRKFLIEEIKKGNENIVKK